MIPAGADISARWFDICILVDEAPIHRQFENSQTGLRQCLKWLETLGIKRLQLALEPTGRYGELVAEWFHRRKHRVVLAQPFKFSRFAESIDMRGKSDFKDSYALSVFSKERGDKLQDWLPRTELELELRDLQLLIRSRTKRSVVLQCQLTCKLRSKWVKQQLEDELKVCTAGLDEALEMAERLVKRHEVLSHDYELLCSIRGIGRKTALLLITLIDFRSFRSSRALACFLGLTPKKHESGTSIRGKEHISKRGNRYVRGALFMPARAARNLEPMAEFAERLLQAHKHDWVIQIAVIRKLVTTAWAVVVHQVPFNPNYKNPNNPT